MLSGDLHDLMQRARVVKCMQSIPGLEFCTYAHSDTQMRADRETDNLSMTKITVVCCQVCHSSSSSASCAASPEDMHKLNHLHENAAVTNKAFV